MGLNLKYLARDRHGRPLSCLLFGPLFKAQMVYFNIQHFIPFQRMAQVCEDLYGQPLSEATIAAANQRAFENLAPFEIKVVELLCQAPVNHADESGVRVAKTLHGLHVVSYDRMTPFLPSAPPAAP